MTIIFSVLFGSAALLIISAIENVSIRDAFSNILAGNITKNAGSNARQEPSSSVPVLGPRPTTANLGSASWLKTGVTQAYGLAGTGVKNTGVDYGTPFHTPISALASGTVVSATYSPEIGGQVLVGFQYEGRQLYAAYVHLDQILVSIGQTIDSGTIVGLSGGQLSGGMHPAKYPYTTGPHTLFGLFIAPSASYENSIDPTAFLSKFGA